MKVELTIAWDVDEPYCEEIRVDGRSVPYMGVDGIRVHQKANDFVKDIVRWKTAEDKRKV